MYPHLNSSFLRDLRVLLRKIEFGLRYSLTYEGTNRRQRPNSFPSETVSQCHPEASAEESVLCNVLNA